MVNYQKGKIYKITSDQTDRVYVGSTCDPLCKRIAKHRRFYKAYLAGTYNRRITSFDILQHGDAVIVLVEDRPCENKEQLFARERYHIENTPNCVNKVIPGRTQAEYNEDNKEALAEKRKVYRESHNEAIATYQKEYNGVYREVNKEAIATYKQTYQVTNKAVRAEKKKAYYEVNKHVLTQNHDCPCGGKYTTQHVTRHNKSKKHQAYLVTKKDGEWLNAFVQELGL